MIAALPVDVLTAFLVFCRVGACFMIMPGMSSMRVPPQIRLLSALAVSVAVTAFVGSGLSDYLAQPSPVALLRLVISELMIGSFFGLVARFYILALEFMVTSIAMAIGFGGMLGTSVTGTEAQSPLTSFVSFAGLMVLFTLNFHHVVITALLGSYDTLPIAQFPDVRLMLVNLLDVLRESFMIALRLGSPFLGFAIIVNLGVGMLNKLSPQIPIYFISLPFILGTGLLILYYAIPYLLSLFGQGFTDVFFLR